MRDWIRNVLSWFDTPWKRTAGAIVLVLTVLVVALSVSWAVAPAWRHYQLSPIGIQVELPRPPLKTGGARDAGNVTFESRSPRLAVLIAGQAFTEAIRARSTAELVRRMVAAIEKNPEITDVKVETLAASLAGKPGVRIAGAFKRGNSPGRLRGFVALEGANAWQIVAFFSDEEGAREADRVLNSVRFVSQTD